MVLCVSRARLGRMRYVGSETEETGGVRHLVQLTADLEYMVRVTGSMAGIEKQ